MSDNQEREEFLQAVINEAMGMVPYEFFSEKFHPNICKWIQERSTRKKMEAVATESWQAVAIYDMENGTEGE